MLIVTTFLGILILKEYVRSLIFYKKLTPMLKVKLFNSHHPLEHQELELSDSRLRDEGCFIGNSPTCGLVLPSIHVKDVHGKLFTERGQYYFCGLTEEGTIQFNDEAIKTEQTYSLETDDIIRIGEFVLIIDGLPIKKKKSNKGKNKKTAKSSNKRSLQDIKNLAKKKHHSHTKPSKNSQTSTHKPTHTLNNSTPNHSASPILSSPLLPGKNNTTAIPKTTPTASSASTTKPPVLNGMQWWSKGELTVYCIQIIEDTKDVKTFRFIAKSPTLFNYKPGQFVTLNLNINGQTVKRSYSISSTPSRPHTLEITVKRVPPPSDVPDAPPGLVSNWLHDHLKVGDEIKITGPFGKFTCVDNNASKLLFISAGSGITPMMSMSRWALDTVANRDIIFLHSARTPNDIIYRQELEAMTTNHANFRLALTMTRPVVGETWWGFTGRLNEILLPAITPDFKERVIYICGPESFMKSVKTLVESLEFPMENYYQESFGSSPKKQSSTTKNQDNSSTVESKSTETNEHQSASPTTVESSESEQTYPVIFSQSEKELMCSEKMSILDLAEQEMIEVDSGCRSGACGSCKLKKVEGNIDYDGEPDGLDTNEQEEGYILACIAYPKGRVVIDA